MSFIDTKFTSALLFDSEQPPPSTAYDDPTINVVYHGERMGTPSRWMQSRALLVSALPCEQELHDFRSQELHDVNGNLAEKLISLLGVRVPVTMSTSRLFLDHLLPFCQQDQKLVVAIKLLTFSALEMQMDPFPPGLVVEETEWSKDLEYAFKRALLAVLYLGGRLDHPSYDVYTDLDDRVPFDYSLLQMGMGLMQSNGAADFGFSQAWAVHRSMFRYDQEDLSE